MPQPLVSICLPNLNTRPFLDVRVASILGQTLTDWELVVSDNHSNDGAWEFFQDLARTDPRVRIAQAPRQGMYANWNNCVRRCSGKYVYIATSDDDMAPDCLEKLAAALDARGDCDVAHCSLIVTDEAGRPIADPWWPDSLFARSVPGAVGRRHVRRAPYDGLLCLSGAHVYYSITETLIRRSLFARVGTFDSRWGSASDFHWHMRVGLVASTVHVPETTATWRLHPTQATAAGAVKTPAYLAKVEEMIGDAIRQSAPHLPPAIARDLDSRWLRLTASMRAYYGGLRTRRRASARRFFQAAALVRGPMAIRREIVRRIAGRPKWPDVVADEIRQWLESLGLDPFEIDACHPPAPRLESRSASAGQGTVCPAP